MSFTIYKHHLCRVEECLQRGVVSILFKVLNEKSNLVSVGIQDDNIVGWSESHTEDTLYCEKINGGLNIPNVITYEILVCCTGATIWEECSFVGTTIDDKGNVFHVFQRRLR